MTRGNLIAIVCMCVVLMCAMGRIYRLVKNELFRPVVEVATNAYWHGEVDTNAMNKTHRKPLTGTNHFKASARGPAVVDYPATNEALPEKIAPLPVLASNDVLPIVWLGSVVTERWRKTGPNAWETVRPQIYGQTSRPDAEIGLRPDGVVVWREVE